MLKDVREHPAVYSAHDISGRNYEVVAVYDTTIGSKATVVVLDVIDNKDKGDTETNFNQVS